ncbi:MAG: MOSC domain-containing protein [Pseudomonadota bacterium]
MAATVVNLCTSLKKGTTKSPVNEVTFIKDFGIEGDAHAGSERQVSLIASESIKKVVEKGITVAAGAFGENVITEGISLYTLPVGTRLKLGDVVELEITQIGKECHHPCHIAKTVGTCVMPIEGVFAKVVTGGVVKEGVPLLSFPRRRESI